MFKTAGSRFTLRGIIAAASAVISAAGTIWIDNPYIKLASVGVGTLSLYFGVGALSPQAEPFVGVKKADPGEPVVPDNL